MNVTQRKRLHAQFQPVGRWIRVNKRLAIYLRDHFQCIYCLKDLHDADPRDVTLDHIISKSDGGSNMADNLVTSCRSCNCARGDKPLKRFVGKETLKHVHRNTVRDLKPYVKLAKAILAGELEYDRDLIK
jgi:5-methylcytosine-specific restriction endonuclease McrA